MPSLDESRRPLLTSLRRALARTTSQTVAFSQVLAAQLGIGPTDLECLAVLQELGPSTAGQLADVLSLTTGAITGVVDCLEFATGASQLRISALDGPDRELYLYRATFEGPQPSARVHDGNVVFRYRRVAPFDWARHTGVVGLNPSIPWGIVLTGGASNVALDARGLQLRELKLDGG